MPRHGPSHAGRPAAFAHRLAGVPLVARPLSRRPPGRAGTNTPYSSIHTPIIAGPAALPVSFVRPVRAGREPLRRGPARDAPARRLGDAAAGRRSLPRKAAAALLAYRTQLRSVRRPRLGRPPAAGPGRPRHDPSGVLLRPSHLRGACGLSRRPGAGPGARFRRRRPAAPYRRRADVLHHAGPVRRVRGGARRPAALGMVAAGRRRLRTRRAGQGAGRPGAAGRPAGASPLADRATAAGDARGGGGLPRRRGRAVAAVVRGPLLSGAAISPTSSSGNTTSCAS